MPDVTADKEYLKKLTVLFVEDDACCRNQIGAFMQRSVGTLISAVNGLEGRDMFLKHTPHIVVTDIIMPVMDGLSMAEAILKRDPAVPVIVLTGFDDAGYLMRAINMGIEKYVIKPIKSEALYNCLLACAHRLRLEEEAQRYYKHTENELISSELKFRSLFEYSRDACLLFHDGKFIDCNQAAATYLNAKSIDDVINTAPDEISPEYQPDGILSRDKVQIVIAKALETGSNRFEWVHRRLGNKEEFQVEVSLTRLTGEMIYVTWHDITELKRAEEEKVKLESQLRQSQKMEAIGQLAGGVAHDFNNMLGVILGYTEMALIDMEQTNPLHESLLQICNAAKRSAELTRQLLAFARKQVIMPLVMDLNETVSAMLKMLQRLIGEDIQLTWRPAANLWQVKADTAQIDQILANLCVNGRDAIESNGRITIETRNNIIGTDFCLAHPDAIPGEYVHLSVSDNGHGMDTETLAHIFEPFFTTKDVGEGTGLGLATVYGVVKQNNGFITVSSKPGEGTTFSIHLPRHRETTVQSGSKTEIAPPQRGKETILVVEDEPAILEMTAIMLEMQGYTVLSAGTPHEAITLALAHDGEIRLLITDVIMPGMNGRELANRLVSTHPGIKRIYMSGYSADVIGRHGVLDQDMHFIQKPFSLPVLAAKVREVLDKNHK